MNKYKELLMKLGSLLALVILCIVLSIASPNFLRINNIMNILRQTSVNSLISSGMLIVLITGGIDLSVGANAILCTCVMATLNSVYGVTNPIILIGSALVVGVFVGYINGILLTKLNLPHPFVSTLGMKFLLCGLALLITNGKTLSNFPDSLTFLGSANIFKTSFFSGIPLSFLMVIGLFVGFHFFLNKITLGRKIYCVGGNAEAARLSGIHSKRVLTTVYMMSGLMAAIASIVLIGRTGVANPASALEPYDTDAIAACIIGGASFMGGKGTIWGTLLGALLITVIRNGLTLLKASSDIQYIVIGAVIILAVFIDVTREKMENNARRLSAK